MLTLWGRIQDFKSLVGAIQIWITTCVRPAVSNDDQCFEASERARNTWIGDAAQGIGRVRNQDFFAASKFPGADESIFLVMIFDLLIDHVFSAKVLYGNQDLQREIDVIRQLEPPMRLNSDSSKGKPITQFSKPARMPMSDVGPQTD